MNSNKALFQYIFFTLLGVTAGFSASLFKKQLYPSVKNSLTLSSHASLSYDDLPCPSEIQYEKLIIQLNFNGELEGTICDGHSNKDKFSKLLKYIYDLKVIFPNSWKGGAKKALVNPFKYIDDTSEKITLDSSDRPSNAYNRDGSFYLGSKFFTSPPLDALLILIHEGRHSSRYDPGHIKCTSGDMAQHHSACDHTFRNDSRAGAYAYMISFSFGLAQFAKSLSHADKEYLIATGLSILGRRFNVVPNFLGLPFETLIVYEAPSQLYYIHPILKELIPIDYGKNLDIEKIKFNRKSNGTLIFTKEGALYGMNPFAKAEAYNNEVLSNEFKIKDYSSLTWSIDQGTRSKTQSYFIDQNNIIWEVIFNYSEDKYEVKQSPFQDLNSKLKDLIHAKKNGRYLLTEEGALKFFKTDEDGNKTLELSMFQDPNEEGWLHIDGGYMYSQTFGVNKAGELVYRNDQEIKPSVFQIPNSILYLEPTNFRIQMNNLSDIYIRRYGSENLLILTPEYLGSNISGLSYIRSFMAEKRFKTDKQVSQQVIDLCQLTGKNQTDPWTKLAMGINNLNELVFQVNQSECKKIDLRDDVTDFTFNGSAVNRQGDFSSVYLQVTFKDGSFKKIYPYATKN